MPFSAGALNPHCHESMTLAMRKAELQDCMRLIEGVNNIDSKQFGIDYAIIRLMSYQPTRTSELHCLTLNVGGNSTWNFLYSMTVFAGSITISYHIIYIYTVYTYTCTYHYTKDLPRHNMNRHDESAIIFSPLRSGLLSFGVRRDSPPPIKYTKNPNGNPWECVGILYARPLSGTHYFDAHYHTPGCRYGQCERLHSFKQRCIGNTQIGFTEEQLLTLLSMVAVFPPK